MIAPLSPVHLGPGAAVLAFDVGGTDTKATLVDTSGALLDTVRVPTPLSVDGTGDAVLAQVEALAARFRAAHPTIDIRAAGLIVPGLVDDESGIGVFSENIGWKNVPFRDLASERLGVPVYFTHDVRAAGAAEYTLGSAGQYSNVLVVVIGTGIASAIFVDGRPYSAHGYAGEIGHAVVDPGGVLCACGGHGCLEAIGSAGAISRLYRAGLGTADPVDNAIGAREVLERAQAGDLRAQKVWSDATDAIGLALAQSVALLAPEAIVIGGGLAQAGDALFGPVEKRMNSFLTFHRRPVLLPATVGENAGLVGAALGARRILTAEPTTEPTTAS
ncbi:ROK family protein [Mycetocola zhadangensis]|uniref:ROK family protein n=1 Tax=Mycetocola zhadangensis TaxID=1164595 RepID=A0A3L7J488_9MICO|nr:ROK family protein [Mycetocola zhadangensis]RLQ85498.1 ROK family protein [Mycetocola zhadangensis]GGE83134.1 glucokinase [Mycetocola zhadangensis]